MITVTLTIPTDVGLYAFLTACLVIGLTVGWVTRGIWDRR